MEMSTPENETLVSEAYTRILQMRAEGRDLSPSDRMLYEVEMLTQEVNSGASFEQYFRWATVAEIRRAAGWLEQLGLPAPAELVREAIAAAFPGGLPSNEAGMDDVDDWDAEQEERLSALADAYTDHNGAIANALASWYRRTTGA